MEQCFYDMSEFELCRKMMQNFDVIKNEVLTYINQPNALHEYPKYSVSYNDETYALYDNYWKAVPITKFESEYVEMHRKEKILEFIIGQSRKNLPFTNSLLSEWEDKNILRNGFISRLVPGSIIRPHCGWSDTFMRIHLGIVCDEKCTITVGNETRAWEEGKVLAFKDGGPFLHSVAHNGQTERVILSVDIRLKYLEGFL